MPIPEPEQFVWRWVKPFSGWPETDEDAVRKLAEGWRAGEAAFTTAGRFRPLRLITAWPDDAGQKYRAKVGDALAEAGRTAAGMAGLADQATRLADAVTHAKTSIRTLMAAGQELHDYVMIPSELYARLAAEVNDILARTAAHVAARPDLPAPLERPEHDPGAGPFGSDPITADQKVQELQYDLINGLVHPFLPDGAEHFAHYFDASGTPMDVNPDDIVRDVPELGVAIQEQLDHQLRLVAEQATANGDYGRPIPFRSQWTPENEPFNITPELDQNWHVAIGNVHHSVTGVATVHPPATPGGAPQVEVTYQTHVYDRYNWDASNPDKYALVDVYATKDEYIAQFHRAGTAQEYDTFGSSAPRTETREVR